MDLVADSPQPKRLYASRIKKLPRKPPTTIASIWVRATHTPHQPSVTKAKMKIAETSTTATIQPMKGFISTHPFPALPTRAFATTMTYVTISHNPVDDLLP